MINLKEETLNVLAEHGKTIEDIEWIGEETTKFRDGYIIPTNKFFEAADTIYDNGYGSEVVNTYLLICGKDWWLERHEYDGSEWWEYKTQPQPPTRFSAESAEALIFYG